MKPLYYCNRCQKDVKPLYTHRKVRSMVALALSVTVRCPHCGLAGSRTTHTWLDTRLILQKLREVGSVEHC